ncbi:MAG: exosome complex RNA-binding protein Csl4 [Candidatus Micrarchaeota archaeon]|nr:exosome complex RNA-binding protein Csl4 [Candidatus Micrarchaeota archaeon]
MQENMLVMPGDKIATEEEFLPGSNTYAEDGIIYAATTGRVKIADGKATVQTVARDIEKINRGMYIVGEVTDNMRSVMFVDIDTIYTKSKEFIAIKDGKIIIERQRPKPAFRERRGEAPRPERPQAPEKDCGVGDIILAKVQYNDPDAYTLTLDDSDSGVIHSVCDRCGSELEYNSKENVLICKECKYNQPRKISPHYNNAKSVEKLLLMT